MKQNPFLFALLLAATLTLTVNTQVVSDTAGNRGLGSNNLYKGERNVWIGERNVFVGADNAIEGFDNKVLGGTNVVKGQVNTISGKGNTVNGEQNTIKGQNNIVVGSGNVVSSDLTSQISFDFENRFPEWMRSSVKRALQKEPNKVKINSQTKPAARPKAFDPIPFVTYAPNFNPTPSIPISEPEPMQQINKPVQMITPVPVKLLQTIPELSVPTIASQSIPAFQSKLEVSTLQYTPQTIVYSSQLPLPQPIQIPRAIPTDRNNDLRTKIQREVEARLQQAFGKAGIFR